MAEQRTSITDIKNRKGGEPIVCLTAYTAPMAKILDPHCDIVLVGDSLGMAMYGMENTLSVTLDMMINHGQAVMCGVTRSCVVVDMPFGTYEQNPEIAYENAKRVITATGCDAVKLEGGQDMADTIQYLTERNIPVMGHIGLLPQSVLKDGGYKVKGKTNEEVSGLIEDAKAIEAAGAFSFVIEGTIEETAANITKSVDIPTIGIGASAACDGQVLVTEDMLGLITDHTPKFVKQYAQLAEVIGKAAQDYAAEVKSRDFPSEEYTYHSKAG